MPLSATRKKQLFEQAIRDLSKLNGLYTADDLAARISLNAVARNSDEQQKYLINLNTEEETQIIQTFINTSDGV